MSVLPVKIFSTTGSGGLADDICLSLTGRMNNVSRAGTKVGRFSNQNTKVQVDEVRGNYVVIIHTQVPEVNENLIELILLIQAINNSGPGDMLLVFPYMPYSRSDQKNEPRISVGGELIPRILTLALDTKRVLLLDPHGMSIKQYFHPYANEISAVYLFCDYIQKELLKLYRKEDCVIVFADAGSAKRYEKVGQITGIRTAYIAKTRPDDSEDPIMTEVVGRVEGGHAIIIDDEVLTGSTAIKDAELLVEAGAVSVSMFAVHAVLEDQKTSPEAVVQRFESSQIDRIVVADSIPLRGKLEGSRKFVVLSIAPLVAEAIKRTVKNESLTELHDPSKVVLYRP